ncbi:MAG: hypothetical protein ACREJM_00235, partial [Candidatus Saccharimonadales bacterium]
VHLAAMKDLRVLYLTNTQITSDGVARLRRLSRLEKLLLWNTLIDDRAIEHLKALPNLQEVPFGQVMVSQAAITDFCKAMPRCKVAIAYWAEDIATCKASFQNLGGRIEVDASLPGEPVIALDLSGLPIGDDVLKRLPGLIRLRDLNLAGAKITDASVDRLLRLTRLRKLDLSGCALTDAGMNELRKQLPECEITQ